MNIAALIEHLQALPSDREVVFTQMYGGTQDVPHLLDAEQIKECTIFVDRSLHLSLCTEREPVRSIEALLMNDHHNEEGNSGVTVKQVVDHLRTYPSDHEIMTVSRSFNEDERHASLYRMGHYSFEERTIFETESLKLRLTKPKKVKRSIQAVIMRSYSSFDEEVPKMTVNDMIEALESYPLHCEMIREGRYPRIVRMSLTDFDFDQRTVFENEHIDISYTASKDTIRSIDAVSLGNYY